MSQLDSRNKTQVDVADTETLDELMHVILTGELNQDMEGAAENVALAFKFIDEAMEPQDLEDFSVLSTLSEFSYLFVSDLSEVLIASEQATERFKIVEGSLAGQLDLSDIPRGESDSTNTHKPQTLLLWSHSLRREVEVVCVYCGTDTIGTDRHLFILSERTDDVNFKWLCDRFGLTKAEVEISKMFYAGASMAAIAENRGRSVATVKTQFYTVLDKCGCSSQVEFLRLLSNQEKKKSVLDTITRHIRKTERHQYLLARPGGRTLDVATFGDPNGDVVISCNTLMSRLCPEKFENYLVDANIYFCAVAPPGSGQTSPAEKGQSMVECFADDIESFLTSLGRENALLFGSNLAFPICLQAAALKPNRISAVLSNTAPIPAGKRLSASNSIYWLTRLRMNLGYRTGRSASWVFHAFMKYLGHIGFEKFVKKALAHSPNCMKAVLDPSLLSMVEDAFEKSFLQGSRCNVELFQQCIFEDWEKHIVACPVPIYLSVGELDSFGPYHALKDLAECHPEKIEFSSIPDVTSAYMFVEPEKFIDMFNHARAQNI